MTDSLPDGEIRLGHLGVVVRRLDIAAALYRRLGLHEAGRETFAQEQIRIAFIETDEARIELIEPLSPTGPLGRFLTSRGEGIHHLAFEVPDIERALARARDAGMRLIDDSPRGGAHGTRVAFIHPNSARGVLVELVEKRSSIDPLR